MRVYITNKSSWKKHPARKIELNIKSAHYAGVKKYKDGYLMYETTKDHLRNQLLKLNPDLWISCG